MPRESAPPALTEGQFLAMSDPVSNFGIPAKAKAENKNAAAAFLNFLLSDEARQILVDNGFAPSGGIVRHAGDVDAADRKLVGDELDRGQRPIVLAVVARARQTGREERRLRVVLVGDHERRAVLADCRSERLTRHREVARVAFLVRVLADLMDRIASLRRPLTAIEPERRVRRLRVGRRNALDAVAHDRGPGQRRVAADRDEEAVEARVPRRDRRVVGVDLRALPARRARASAVRDEELSL